jgi:hypothetical protein
MRKFIIGIIMGCMIISGCNVIGESPLSYTNDKVVITIQAFYCSYKVSSEVSSVLVMPHTVWEDTVDVVVNIGDTLTISTYVPPCDVDKVYKILCVKDTVVRL